MSASREIMGFAEEQAQGEASVLSGDKCALTTVVHVHALYIGR